MLLLLTLKVNIFDKSLFTQTAVSCYAPAQNSFSRNQKIVFFQKIFERLTLVAQRLRTLSHTPGFFIKVTRCLSEKYLFIVACF